MMAVDMVEDAGFEALEASDATQAIEILETRQDVRIVFTDIDMPRGMDGVKLAACIRGRWPPIDIIVTSGHRSAPDLKLPQGSVFFSKPFRGEEVVAAMRRMVD